MRYEEMKSFSLRNETFCVRGFFMVLMGEGGKVLAKDGCICEEGLLKGK
jgi:hypothetical protein